MAVNIEGTMRTSVFPHFGHCGGDVSNSARWLIGLLTSNASPQARHSKA
jgi:hypothetical protein